MHRLIKWIPNTITCLNLFSGCMACLAAFGDRYELSALWIGLAAVFDFCDGLSARLLHAYSPIGKELDSLADVISFGLAPGLLVYMQFPHLGFPDVLLPLQPILPYIAFFIPVFSALRLAKFNIDDRQTTSFIGLPVPANALFWIGAVFFIRQHAAVHPLLLAALILLFSWLLVSPIPMFSLKLKNLSWSRNKWQYILTAITIAALISMGISGLTVIIALYIILSLIAGKNSNK